MARVRSSRGKLKGELENLSPILWSGDSHWVLEMVEEG
jgi:hypothetical protein